MSEQVDATVGMQALCTLLGAELPELDAERVGAERFKAPNFNVFRLFKPNENTLTWLIEDLLDPKGSHGQGPLFINALFGRVGLQKTRLGDIVSIRNQAVTSHCRIIDTVIETPHVIVGIEHKPWAGQQPNQLSDYFAALRKWSRGRDTVLIFLSEKEPESAANDVTILRYAKSNDQPSLQEAMEDALPEIQAPRVRQHIEELIAYIIEQFGYDRMNSPALKNYVKAVEREFADPTRRRSVAMVTYAGIVSLRLRTIDEIGTAIMTELRVLHSDFADLGRLSAALLQKDIPWTIRRPHWPKNTWLMIESFGMDATKVWIGVHAPDEDSSEVELGEASALRSGLSSVIAEIPGGNVTPWCPWWTWTNERHWSAELMMRLILESPTGLVRDHSFVRELAATLAALASTIDAQIVESG